MTTSTLDLRNAPTRSSDPSTARRSSARFVAYPAVLLGDIGLVAWAQMSGAPLETVTLFGLLGTIAAFFVLEQLLPHRSSWQPSWKEGLRDLFYFGMNGGIDAGLKLGIAFAVAGVGVWSNGLPLWAALPIAVLVADFFGYWLHRFGHLGWLWKVHGVHHTPDKVNAWNNNTIHFINTIYGGLGKTLPLLALGFSPEAIILASFVLTIQSFAVHANVDVEVGPLGYVLMTPVHHRLHHSTKLEEAGNYASATTLWDILFGSFVYGRDLEPHTVGVTDPGTFPAPNAVVRNQVHPFVDQGR